MIFLSGSLFIIQETDQAIITQFGEYIRSVNEPGLHFKIPFIQKVFYFEKRVLESDAAPSEYLTGDMKRILVDHVTRWRIEDPHEFYKSVRTEIAAITRLDDIVTGRLREEIARHEFIELIRDKREMAMATVTAEARERAKNFGIHILDTRIKRLDLPKEVEGSIFDRMEAERHRMAKRYRAEGEESAREIRAAADRDKEIILATSYEISQTLKGFGDARATSIYAEAYEQNPEFYSFLKRLEIYQEVIPGSTLVLDASSDLFSYLQTSSPNEGENHHHLIPSLD